MVCYGWNVNEFFLFYFFVWFFYFLVIKVKGLLDLFEKVKIGERIEIIIKWSWGVVISNECFGLV